VDDCWGTADDVECAFYFPGHDLYLLFAVLRYPSGLRVTDVRCVESGTGDVRTGGVADCARLIRES
jgi:hypothetical protein